LRYRFLRVVQTALGSHINPGMSLSMTAKYAKKDTGRSGSRENIAFIRQMLAELRQVAEKEKADMLCYLIEMAYVEAGDLHSRM
jgi:hypothetical protein